MPGAERCGWTYFYFFFTLPGAEKDTGGNFPLNFILSGAEKVTGGHIFYKQISLLEKEWVGLFYIYFLKEAKKGVDL